MVGLENDWTLPLLPQSGTREEEVLSKLKKSAQCSTGSGGVGQLITGGQGADKRPHVKCVLPHCQGIT